MNLDENVKRELSALISEISYRKTLYSIIGDELRVENYKELEEKAISLVKTWNKYDVVKLLCGVLNDDFVDDAIKAKFIRLASAVIG